MECGVQLLERECAWVNRAKVWVIVAKSLPYENSEHDWVTAAHVVVVVLELTVFPEAGVSGTRRHFLVAGTAVLRNAPQLVACLVPTKRLLYYSGKNLVYLVKY